MVNNIRQVDPVFASLNEGDVFVLDAGSKIFVWVGREAGIVKQSKGLEIANMINSENKSKGSVTLMQGASRDANDAFWEIMGGKGEVAPAEEALTDQEVAEEMADSVFLYRYASAVFPYLFIHFFVTNVPMEMKAIC